MSRLPERISAWLAGYRAFLPPGTERAWSGLKPRERDVVRLGATLLALGLLWKAIWLPSQAYLNDAQQRYTRNAILETSLAQHRDDVAATHPARPESLSSVITSTAQAAGIGIIAIAARSSNQLEVRSAPVPFPTAIGWLRTLETDQRLRMADVELNKSGEGIVTVRVTVARPKGS